MTALYVNEIFGPTFQGEGPHAGRFCVFVRLNRCNLKCAWCDTPFTWAYTENAAENHRSGKLWPKQETAMTAEDIGAVVSELASDCIVVISGGEPLLQRDGLRELARELVALGYEVHVETAGTIDADDLGQWVDHWTVSPKLMHSNNLRRAAYKPDVLADFAIRDNATFKYVVRDVGDVNEAAKQVRELKITPDKVMIMPEGTDAETVLRVAKEVADVVLRHGFGLTLRNHVLLWGDERRR